MELVEAGQLTLFDEQPTSVDIQFLHVVKDLQNVQMSVGELFNPSVYDELLAVTYVASPRFFFNTTKKFKSISLILGIEDGDVASPFTSGLESFLDIEKRINFIKSLPQAAQESICSNQYQIRYAKQGFSVHSKFYLLKGQKGNRIILGSANFTENAFQSKKQFEEIVVFDDSPLFDIYQDRYHKIYEQTSEYIPEAIKTKITKEHVWVSDPEIMKEILIDEVIRNKVIVQFTEEEMEEIKLLPDKIEVEREDAIKYKQIVEVITKKDTKTGIYKLIPVLELKKKSIPIKTILSKTHKKSDELDNRFKLIYNDATSILYTETLLPAETGSAP